MPPLVYLGAYFLLMSTVHLHADCFVAHSAFVPSAPTMTHDEH